MLSFRTAKIYFCFAALLLVAKPFLGFSMFSRLHPPAGDSIFIKSFTKRFQEYSENSDNNLQAILKKLSEPDANLFLRFSFLLSILFPLAFVSLVSSTSGYLQQLRFALSFRENTYLLNSNLII
jgi:hypothetical protein